MNALYRHESLNGIFLFCTPCHEKRIHSDHITCTKEPHGICCACGSKIRNNSLPEGLEVLYHCGNIDHETTKTTHCQQCFDERNGPAPNGWQQTINEAPPAVEPLPVASKPAKGKNKRKR